MTKHILNDLPQQKVSGSIMKYPLVRTVRSLTGIALVLLGLSTYGCGDTGTATDPAELGNLSVSAGDLQPAFSPAITSYTVQLSTDVSSTTITATPRVAGDTIRIDNQQVTSQTITLDSPGAEKSVNIVVTETGTGGTSKAYTVQVIRDLEDNSLQALSVSSGTLAPSPFDKDTLNYSVNGVGASVNRITISATKSDQDSIMQIGSVTVPAGTPSGQAIIQLGNTGAATPVSIDITRPSGSKKTYTVTINRGPSGNSFLQSLSLPSGLRLNQTFRSSLTAYTVDVANNVTSITVTPRAQDTTAGITVNGQATNSGQPSQPIFLNEPGINASRTNINIVVIAQNNIAQTVYTVTFIRAALGGNNNLSALSVRAGTTTLSLSPLPFDEDTLVYTGNVTNNVNEVAVTVTRQNANASITVNGQPTNSGQARTITLNPAGQSPSTTTIPIVVTAQNGSQKAYTVNVIRAALGGNNNLSALSVRAGTTTLSLSPSPFDEDTLVYTGNVTNNVNEVAVTATRQNANASITVNGQPTNSGQARTITLNPAGQSPSTTTIPIVVTAQNGSQKAYAVNVIRAALNGNNNLQSLSVSQPGLSPSPFRADRTVYTLNVGSNIDNVTVTASPQDTSTSMSMRVNNGTPISIAAGQASPPISLAPGPSSTEIEVIVRAQNQSEKPYVITVNRPAPSSNTNLSALSVTAGTTVTPFSSPFDSNTVTVAPEVGEVVVRATKSDANATMAIGSVTIPPGTRSGQSTFPLNGAGGEPTPISITVTAQNGVDVKTYAISVIRPAAPPPPANPATAPDLMSEDDSCQLFPGTSTCFPPTSNSDNLTNVKRPGFSVPSPGSGETAKVYIRKTTGEEFPSSSTPAGNTLIFRPNADLPDGLYDITYTLSNSVGESDKSPVMTPQLEINTIINN